MSDKNITEDVLKPKNHPDHNLWRLMESHRLLQASYEAYPGEVKKSMTEEMCHIEHEMAQYTPKTLDGLKAKAYFTKNEYFFMCTSITEESDPESLDTQLVLSILRDIEVLNDKSFSLHKDKPVCPYHSGSIETDSERKISDMEAHIVDLEAAIGFWREGCSSKNADEYITTRIVEHASEIIQIYDLRDGRKPEEDNQIEVTKQAA